MAKDNKSVKVIKQGGDGMFGFAYCLAVIGAIVYFVQQSVGFWGFILAILKGFVWPAFVIYEVLDRLNL
ncbi:MAG TPA: hypothetical protein VFX86_01050 [Candidatus Saccharimonadales bacterium]|nr:hypothetical protein [Candidatus Saccharimonadales bacterium]